ncbi:MAG: hypothetical protein P4M07_15320 [Xanthobacteraceae bacterium]|nr:hypothetical protein [Xanthobacteraceae bacterium]
MFPQRFHCYVGAHAALLVDQAGWHLLKSLGAVEVPRARYLAMLAEAPRGFGDFGLLPTDRPMSGAEAIEILTTR